ncbi:hypothetical protein [Streptosporangium sp. KLBMP 9127]|nr:hypothetical protein [Streptosporangium sp. KLBMP 9127]
MSDPLDALERRIGELRGEVRRAVKARQSTLARSLRGELRKAELAWDDAVSAEHGDAPEPAGTPSLLPVREQVHQALALLGVPTAARLVVAVHEAFFAGGLSAGRLTSLRRDEERSFRTAPFSRPYYLCAALTDRLSPARGLLAVSTWPLEQRIVGPLSHRVDFLVSASRIAEHLGRLTRAGEDAPPGALRLLSRMAQNIPGAVERFGGAEPQTVIRAAAAELTVHLEADTAGRAGTAERAARQLGDVEQLFGAATLSHAQRGA